MVKKSVLVIDDNIEVCKEIKYSLQNETTEVYYALSVRDGINQLTKRLFCLVIMDILLSEADGIDLLKLIRQIKPIPILVLSSKPGSEDRIAALKAGAHGYVEKPYDMEECLAHAQSLMELYAQLHTSESRCYTLAFGMDLIIDPVKHQPTKIKEDKPMAKPYRILDFRKLYPEASEEVIAVLRTTERKMQYQEYDLKVGRTVIDQESCTVEQSVQFAEDAASAEEQALKNIQSQQLHKALLFLSDDERDLIDRLFFRDQTEREVTAEYGLSQKAVNKRRQKVLAKLREQLKNL